MGTRNEFYKTRAKLGMTQKQMGDACGKTVETIANWEHGRTIPEKMAEICRLVLEEMPVKKIKKIMLLGVDRPK